MLPGRLEGGNCPAWWCPPANDRRAGAEVARQAQGGDRGGGAEVTGRSAALLKHRERKDLAGKVAQAVGSSHRIKAFAIDQPIGVSRPIRVLPSAVLGTHHLRCKVPGRFGAGAHGTHRRFYFHPLALPDAPRRRRFRMPFHQRFRHASAQ